MLFRYILNFASLDKIMLFKGTVCKREIKKTQSFVGSFKQSYWVIFNEEQTNAVK